MNQGNGNRPPQRPHPPQHHRPQIPAGTMPLGHGGNVTAIPSWDKLSPLSEATDMNRGGSNRVSEGQPAVVVADLRPPGWAVAHNLIVALGIRPVGRPESLVTTGFVDSSVKALIRWGIGSAQFEARVDWLNGTQLVIAAEQITVSAEYTRRTYPEVETNPLLCLPNDNAEPRKPICYDVSAGFAIGAVGKHSNPSRFTEIVQIDSTTAPNNKQRIAIPPFAISFTVLVVGAESGNVAQADVFGFGTSYFVRHVVAAPETNAAQLNTEFAFPLQNGAQFVEITNTKGTDTPLIAFVVFGLAL
jgi:hypothetical protein